MNSPLISLFAAALFSLFPATVATGHSVAKPKARVSAHSQDARLEASARALLTSFLAGRYEETGKDFDETMKTALPPERLAKQADELKEMAGAYRSIAKVQIATEQGHRVVNLICSYEKRLIDVKVVFDPKAKVTALFFMPTAAD